MDYRALLLVPAALGTLFVPQAQALPGIGSVEIAVAPQVAEAEVLRDAEPVVEEVNLEPVVAVQRTAPSKTEVRPISTKPVDGLNPALTSVCACESTGSPNKAPRHYEADGVTVLRGRINYQDVGMCQINLTYHEATALRMGLDLFTPEGNAAYANFLYRTQGYRPWSASAGCHGKY